MKKAKGKGGKSKQGPQRCVPKSRIKNPFFIETTTNFETLPFSPTQLPSSTPFYSMESSRKIYPTGNLLESDLHFSCMFESGNLESVFVRRQFAYEIHIRSDPGNTSQWYFFQCDNVLPGEYTFVITGFHSDTGIHHNAIAPVAISINEWKNGKAWKRIGRNINYWKSVSGNPPEYTISFQFIVESADTMYFAYSYPYTYTQLNYFMSSLPKSIVSKPAKSSGGLVIPLLFWSAEMKKFTKLTNKKIPEGEKPLIIVAARHTPSETGGSYAMEGFMKFLASDETGAMWLKENFSFLIIPMVNVDGVVCGFSKPCLGGTNMNLVWKKLANPEAKSITNIVDALAKTRKVTLFLDFHMNFSLWNVFVKSVINDENPMNKFQGAFSTIMAEECKFFDLMGCSTAESTSFVKTMRTSYQKRYNIPFSYSLEMSYGGCNLFRPYNQFTPTDYRFIGESACKALHKMFSSNSDIIRSMHSSETRKRSRKSSSKVASRAMTPTLIRKKKSNDYSDSNSV